MKFFKPMAIILIVLTITITGIKPGNIKVNLPEFFC